MRMAINLHRLLMNIKHHLINMTQHGPIRFTVFRNLFCNQQCTKQLWDLVQETKRESERLSKDWTMAAPPAVLDPHHLPQLLPLFNCHSDWQWTQSPVIIVAAWWLGQVMPSFQDLSSSICSCWYLTELNPPSPPSHPLPSLPLVLISSRIQRPR